MNLDGYGLGAAAGSWVLTYLLHTTVLLSLAALAALALRKRPELEEAIWKVALVGGLLTASVQPLVTDGWAQRPLPIHSQAILALETPLAVVNEVPMAARVPTGEWQGGEERIATWRRLLIVAWASIAGVLIARLLLAAAVLRRRLAGRRPLGGPLSRLVRQLLEASGRRRGVRLTRSEGIPVPIALRAEICMPERALCELPRHEQESVVAHEMAHILRRDPVWLLVGKTLGALFFFHPLVLLAGRRMRRAAELRCDDWAVAVTGRPLALARCLTRVASWRGDAVQATAMAGDPGRLAGRVARLLDRDGRQIPPATPRWLGGVAAAVLLGAVLGLPGVSLAGDSGGEAVAVPQAPPAPVAPPAPPVPVQAVVPSAPEVAALAPAPSALEVAVVAPVPSTSPVAVVVPAPSARPVAIAAPAPIAPTVPGVPPAPSVAPAPVVAPALAAPAVAPPAARAPVAAEAVVATELARLEARLAAAELQAHGALATEPVRQGGAAEPDRQREVRHELQEQRQREVEHAREELMRQARLFGEERQALAEEARRMAQEAHERVLAERQELERVGEQATTAQREEMQRLAEELAAQQGRLAAEHAAERQRLAEELHHRRQALAEQARLLAEEARQRAGDLEISRREQRELSDRLAAETDRALAEARRELERMTPEMERLRGELRLRTEERAQLQQELEALRREVEALRRAED